MALNVYLNKAQKYKEKLKILQGGKYDPYILTYIVDCSKKINNINNQIKWDFEGGEFPSSLLDINNDKTYIEQICNKHKYLELRKYNGEKTLVIACGNRRIDNSNIGLFEQQDNYSNGKRDRISMNRYHSHRNAYTIDPALVANSSLIANFNDTSNFSESIPDNSFDYIIFEGGGVPHTNDSEIQRMLNKNNQSFCICNGTLENPFEYIVYSYYDFGNYMLNGPKFKN